MARLSTRETYHRPLEAVWVGLELLQRLLLVHSTLDDRADTLGSNISQNCLQLIGRRWVLGNIELKLLGPLRTVITGLVDRCGGAGVGGHLLQEGEHLSRRRGARLVKEGDDVEGFALEDDCELLDNH